MRKIKSIDTGSMADIAFLLLVFFLVTTSIDTDYGITSQISKPSSEELKTELKQHLLMINEKGNYLFNGRPINNESIVDEMNAKFVKSKGVKNVITVKTSRLVTYNHYIAALDATKSAFHKYHNDIAIHDYGISYKDLSATNKRLVLENYPTVLAEDVVEQSK